VSTLTSILQASSKARFTLGVKPNLELKSSIPIGAITEISPKGFTLVIKVEKENIFKNLIFYGPDFVSRQKKKIPINLGGQFATLGLNVVAIKYCHFDEIYTLRSK
jgi:hypothetical protein